MPIIFIKKDTFSDSGWRGIGEYSFEYFKTIEALSTVGTYIIIFVFIAIIFDKLFIKEYRVHRLNFNNQIVNKLESLSKYKYIFALLLVFQVFLSNYMFQNQIAIIGLPNNPMPFKLNGILYYYRYLIIPLFSLILLFSNYGKKNNLFIFLIVLEAILSGIFSASKSVLIFHVIPVIIYLLMMNRKLLSILISILTIVSVGVTAIGRNFLYFTDTLYDKTLYDILVFVFSDDRWGIDYFFILLGGLIARIGGYKEFFATFFNDLQYVDINLFFYNVLGLTSFRTEVFLVERDIYHMVMPEGYAFAMAIDSLSSLYLSTENYFDVLMLISIWVLLLVISEKLINMFFIAHKSSILYVLLLNLFTLVALVNPNVRNIFFEIPIYFIVFFILKRVFICKNKEVVYDK